jgi:hypothetical protein
MDHDLRNDVAGPLDDHEIAFADVLATDVVLVVQRRARDGHASDVDGLELGERVQDACPTYPHVDLSQPRHGARRGPLEGTREPGALVERAEPSLLVE